MGSKEQTGVVATDIQPLTGAGAGAGAGAGGRTATVPMRSFVLYMPTYNEVTSASVEEGLYGARRDTNRSGEEAAQATREPNPFGGVNLRVARNFGLEGELERGTGCEDASE